MKATRPCLTCGRPTRATRCPACHKARRRQLYGGNWTRYAQARIAASPRCSICGSSEDLTLDHSTNTVMCRPHNSSRRWN